MILALTSMSAGWQAAFYIAAVVCFVLGALGVPFKREALIAAGRALFAFVYAWQALDAA